MNDVRATQVTSPVVIPPPVVGPSATDSSVARVASSPKVDEANALPLDGKELPLKETDAESKSKPTETVAAQIEQAVSEINEYVQSIQRDLHFSVDKDSGLTIVRVRDKESGELIRQIPEDIFLSLAQNLKDNQAIHLFDAHG